MGSVTPAHLMLLVVCAVIMVLGLAFVFVVTCWSIRRSRSRREMFSANGAEPYVFPESFLHAVQQSRWIGAVQASWLYKRDVTFDSGWQWTQGPDTCTGYRLMKSSNSGSLAIQLPCECGRFAGTVVVVERPFLVRRLLAKPSLVTELWQKQRGFVQIVHPEHTQLGDRALDALAGVATENVTHTGKLGVQAIEFRPDCAWLVVRDTRMHLISTSMLVQVLAALRTMVGTESG